MMATDVRTCMVCERSLEDHTLAEARACAIVLAAQAEALEERSCGGSTPAALARMARA